MMTRIETLTERVTRGEMPKKALPLKLSGHFAKVNLHAVAGIVIAMPRWTRPTIAFSAAFPLE